MDWNLAIEKNLGALRRILAMLVAMAVVTSDRDADSCGARCATLPRHLHRYVLRLLRPAEAATRRLIIIAARGLVIKLPRPRLRKPKPNAETRVVYVLDRVDGRMVSVPIVVPQPFSDAAISCPARRSSEPSFPLLDPFKRFGSRRRYARQSAGPRIRLLGGDDPIVPFFRQAEPAPPPASAPPAPDDPLDAARLYQRLDVLVGVLDDLPAQAERMARWQARRDAKLAAEREHRLHDVSLTPDVVGGRLVAGPVESLPEAAAVAAPKRRRFQRLSPCAPGVRPDGGADRTTTSTRS
jgi:hypothetical protein